MRTNALPKIAGRRIAAAALALGLAPAFATGAQAAEGNEGKWYFGLNVPVMFIDNTETEVSGTSVENPSADPLVFVPYKADAVLSYGTGFRIGGTVGYYVLPNLRVEGEFHYGFARVKKNVIDNIRVGPGSPALPGVRARVPVSGTVKMLGAMANAWYDIETGSDFIPFVGGGIGVFQIDQSGLKYENDALARTIAANTGGSASDVPDGFTPRPADKDTAFAFQFGGGVGYRVDDATTVHLSYKYFMAPGLEFDGRNALGNTIKTKSDMKIHLFEVGFRYHF